MSRRLPDAAERLFSDICAPEELAGPRSSSFLINRLLEDGDRQDLAWLVSGVPEEELAAWVRARGGRQLSRRSAAFWTLLLGLDREQTRPKEVSELLWPL